MVKNSSISVQKKRVSRSNPEETEQDRAEIKARLAGLAEQLGSVNSLAKAAGIAQSSTRNFLRRGNGSILNLLALAQGSGVRSEWLLTGEGPREVCALASGHMPANPLVDDYLMVPQYEVRASAGGGSLAEDSPAMIRVPFPRCWLRGRASLNPETLCVIEVEGDSMEPTLHAGEMILVDRADSTPRDGLYTLTIGESLIVKRLQLLGDGNSLQIISDNSRYGPLTRPLCELGEQVRIIGRVIGSFRRLA